MCVGSLRLEHCHLEDLHNILHVEFFILLSSLSEHFMNLLAVYVTTKYFVLFVAVRLDARDLSDSFVCFSARHKAEMTCDRLHSPDKSWSGVKQA